MSGAFRQVRALHKLRLSPGRKGEHMATTQDRKRVVELVTRLVRAHAFAQATLEELLMKLQQWDDLGDSLGSLANLLGSRLRDPAMLYSTPIIDSATMTVTWHGRTCRLGPSLLFRLAERLARRPGHHVAFERLIRDVWDGQQVADETIRSAVRRLRSQLKESGMEELAGKIRSVGGYYVLDLSDTSDRPS